VKNVLPDLLIEMKDKDMEYIVSEKNRQLMKKILSLPQVQSALEFIEKDHEKSIEEQIELCLIESPTYHEEKRAARYMEMLEETGIVHDISVDGHNDVTGFVHGAEDDRVLLEAHLDTVFPFGTVTEVRKEGDTLYAPGIYDDARGLAVLLSALRGLKESGLSLGKSLIVGGTSREEVPGCGAGMRELLTRYSDVRTSISVDGGFIGGINLSGNYSAVVEYKFLGVGGHAGNNYGKCANPLGAASRAVAELNDIVLPEGHMSSCSVTQLFTPEDSGVSSIPSSCILRISYRSQNKDEYKRIEGLVDQCVADGCKKETDRWGMDEITFEKNVLFYFPGGEQDHHNPIIEAHVLASEAVGEEVWFRSGSSNGNIAMEMGVNATTVGSGKGNRKAHSVYELFCTDKAYLCPQGLFLLLLMVCGIDGITESCMDD